MKILTSFREDKAFITKAEETPSCINTTGEVLFCLDCAKYADSFSDGMARFHSL